MNTTINENEVVTKSIIERILRISIGRFSLFVFAFGITLGFLFYAILSNPVSYMLGWLGFENPVLIHRLGNLVYLTVGYALIGATVISFLYWLKKGKIKKYSERGFKKLFFEGLTVLWWKTGLVLWVYNLFLYFLTSNLLFLLLPTFLYTLLLTFCLVLGLIFGLKAEFSPEEKVVE